jgi:chromosomal replication initiation ATPase DnaA
VRAPSFEGLGALGAIVSNRVGDAAFRSWFKNATVAADSATMLTIALPSKFFADEVRSRFGDVLLQGAQVIDPAKQRVEVVSAEGSV